MILYCHCSHAGVAPDDVRRGVLAALCERGLEFEAVADLCGLAARRDPLLRAVADTQAPIIIACYPRAVRWLFEMGGAPLPDNATILNMRTEPLDAILRALPAEGTAPTRDPAAVEQELRPAPDDWVPWFPVIDRSRCRGCQQCANFCLFGVFTIEDGTVVVKNPANCKTNCPACARICPQVAIMFPKLAESPINGAEVTEEDLARENLRVKASMLCGGDIYSALRERSRARRQRFAPAAQEGPRVCACMVQELQKRLGIPAEVLQSLSIEEVQARLKAAARKENQ